MSSFHKKIIKTKKAKTNLIWCFLSTISVASMIHILPINTLSEKVLYVALWTENLGQPLEKIIELRRNYPVITKFFVSILYYSPNYHKFIPQEHCTVAWLQREFFWVKTNKQKPHFFIPSLPCYKFFNNPFSHK